MDQGQQQCCHTKHKKFPYRSTHDVSLLSGHAWYIKNIEMDQPASKHNRT
jgi:hypothetical protein